MQYNNSESGSEFRPSRGRGRGRGRGGYYQRQNKKDVECFTCHRYGHYSWECQDDPKEENMKAHYAEENKVGDDTVLLAHDGANEDKENSWYFDTGTSNHMCGYEHMFVEMDESMTGNITFGDMSKIPVKGKGKILIKLKNGGHQFISNVYDVPEMKANILSMGQLLEKGYDIHMKDKCLYLRDDRGSLIARVPMSSNRMFLMNIHHNAPKCLKACFDNQSWLWHLRLGHLNFGGLKLMSTKNMVNGLPSIHQPDQLCEACLVGKQHRHSFPKESISRAKVPLELIHTYKSEVFSTFEKFKAIVEKHSGYQVKAMRYDRGVCAVYLSNRSPTRSVWNQTPQEAWSGYKPSVSHLKVFGSIAYVHVPDQQRKKLDDKSEKFIFIGYSQESKGYKLYNPVDKKMKVSRDVTFDEKSSWDWTDRDKEQYVFYPIDTDRKEVEEESIEPVTPSSPVSPTQSSPSSSSMFDDFKKKMAKEFEMTGIGLMSYYLGIEVKQRDDGIFISQEAYAKEVLKKFNMENCNPITFTWTSKKQSIVILSTCEAEYVAATSTVCHAIWLRSLLKELSLIQDESTQIYVDNKSAIALAKNPVFHDRSKHIDTRYHFFPESIAKKEVQVKFVKSKDQVADIFTKPRKEKSSRSYGIDLE
ncbi:hypothetical protein RJ640_001268 [Escallonia rubra]|uniref:CCHC-type domain-containing protein n=1 Tax=Escallonia rubra TaxID=112253 RepID=A0AA88UHE1_9ASTE|nr:hypothetical protein RJ640_001268 [Escallonia rubra]